MGRFRESGRNIILFRGQKNYWQQAISRREIIGNVIKAIGITVITGWLYFHSLWSLFLIWPLGIGIYRHFEEEGIRKKKGEFLIQFKEMTENMASVLNVGYSVENALKETQKEMKLLYPEKTVIGEELEIMVRQIRLQIPLEQALDEFAQRVELEDVRNFASVFSAAKRSGGDMIAIIRNTVNQIGDKIDVKREIDTLLAAKRYEFRVMCVIPYAMIAYMQFSFPEFMSSLYGNVIGIGVMSICLLIYAGACLIGARLIRIEV